MAGKKNACAFDKNLTTFISFGRFYVTQKFDESSSAGITINFPSPYSEPLIHKKRTHTQPHTPIVPPVAFNQFLVHSILDTRSMVL